MRVQGDPRAELFEHIAALHAFARSLCSWPDTADELVQGTLAIAWTTIGQYAAIMDIAVGKTTNRAKRARPSLAGLLDLTNGAPAMTATCGHMIVVLAHSGMRARIRAA